MHAILVEDEGDVSGKHGKKDFAELLHRLRELFRTICDGELAVERRGEHEDGWRVHGPIYGFHDLVASCIDDALTNPILPEQLMQIGKRR